MKQYLFSLLALSVLSVSAQTDKITGTVTGNSLNVRIQPIPAASVVCQLNKGDKVSIESFKNDWICINLPTKSRGWVRKAALKEDVIVEEGSQIHTGPGGMFTAFGTTVKGAKVIIKESKGSWCRIEGGIAGLVWVHGAYVDVPEQFRPKAVIQTPVQHATTTPGRQGGEIPHSSVDPTKEPTRVKVDGKMSIETLQGESDTPEIVPISTARRISKSGVVIKLEAKEGRPWTHALAAQINSKFYPLYYLGTGLQDIEKWEMHRVQISGDQQWVRGWPRPMLDVRDIKHVR